MIGSIPHKLRMHWLSRFNKTEYVRQLEIDCPDPEKVHLYGSVDFGTEPWIISMGTDVYITDGVKFITHDGGTLLFRGEIPDLEITKPITLGSHVYIGNNAILMPGVTVGDWCIIGAGAVVTHDIPSREIWGGVPARRIKSVDDYLQKASADSLHLGHLKGAEKDAALRKHFGHSKG